MALLPPVGYPWGVPSSAGTGPNPGPPLSVELPEERLSRSAERTGGKVGTASREALDNLRRTAKQARHDARRGRTRTRAWRQAMYLKVLSLTGKKGEARRFAGIRSPQTLSEWRRYNVDGFRDREEQALVTACDNLEDMIWQWAYEGDRGMAARLLSMYRNDLQRRGLRGVSEEDQESTDPRTIARELRAVWEELGDWSPPLELGASDSGAAIPARAGNGHAGPTQ